MEPPLPSPRQSKEQPLCRPKPRLSLSPQVKKTMEATLSTIHDMVTVEDYDVSECFHHSNSMESVKSTFSESYLSKPSLAKRRANQQETEQFYFTVSGDFISIFIAFNSPAVCFVVTVSQLAPVCLSVWCCRS